jgi:hypothetical protein
VKYWFVCQLDRRDGVAIPGFRARRAFRVARLGASALRGVVRVSRSIPFFDHQHHSIGGRAFVYGCLIVGAGVKRVA